MRTRTPRPFPARAERLEAPFGDIHAVFPPKHPMDRAFHGMLFHFHGHFLKEKSHRFAPYSGKKAPPRGPAAIPREASASLSSLPHFRANAAKGAGARKNALTVLKNSGAAQPFRPRGRLRAASQGPPRRPPPHPAGSCAPMPPRPCAARPPQQIRTPFEKMCRT